MTATTLPDKIESILAHYAKAVRVVVDCVEHFADEDGCSKWCAIFYSPNCMYTEWASFRQTAIERLFRKILESGVSLEEMLVSTELVS